MNFTSVPIIVVCCYIIGELFKLIFKNKHQAYKYIPVVLSCFGGILGVLIYLTSPQLIIAEQFWDALFIGIVSGASSTGANQIIKQLFEKSKTDDKTD